MRPVDARIEQRDDDAASVETRDLEARDRCGQRSGEPERRVVGRRVRNPYGIDAHDLAVAVEERERGRIQSSGKRVQDADVAMLGRHLGSTRRDPPEELLLRADGSCRPRAHLGLRGPTARCLHARGKRRRAEDDDVPLRRRDGRAHAEHSLPARLVDRDDRRCRRAGARTPEEESERDGAQRAGKGVTRSTHTHPGRDSGESAEAPCSEPRTRSSPHCPCRARAEQNARREAPRAGPSSRRRRQRRRGARAPSASPLRTRDRVKRPDDRVLVRGREIGFPPLDLELSELPHRVEERGLEPGEREVETRDPRDRERECLVISTLRQRVDRCASRVAEPEQTCSLVERLAGCVVERRPEAFGAPSLSHREQQGVATAREQAEKGRLDRIRTEIERCHMTFEVIDWYQRQRSRPGDRLRRREADEQRADEPGPWVTAMRSTSSSDVSAVVSASRTTGSTSSRCCLDATSGTTPP